MLSSGHADRTSKVSSTSTTSVILSSSITQASSTFGDGSGPPGLPPSASDAGGVPTSFESATASQENLARTHRILTICLSTILPVLVVVVVLVCIYYRRRPRQPSDDIFVPLTRNLPTVPIPGDSSGRHIDSASTWSHHAMMSDTTSNALSTHTPMPDALPQIFLPDSQRSKTYSVSSDALSYYDPPQPLDVPTSMTRRALVVGQDRQRLSCPPYVHSRQDPSGHFLAI